MVSEVIADPGALVSLRDGWDALAVACGRPFCAPDWLMGWWDHARPPGARLRVVVVRDGDAVVGVAPWFMGPDRLGVRALRPLGVGACQQVEPLAVAGRAPEIAARIAGALHARPDRPDVLRFEGVTAESPWPRLMAHTWPGGAGILHRGSDPAPTLRLDTAGFDAWLAGKSRNFRHDLRKKRRAFERLGGAARMATPRTLEADLAAFARLHYGRWAPRGGSGALDAGIEAMLRDAGDALLDAGRLRLWSLDLDGEVISSHLAVTAGHEYAYWLAGFDDRHARLSPSLLGALAVVQDAFAVGARRLDFGAGAFAYKLRFADGEQTQEHVRIIPHGPRAPLALATQAPGQVRRLLREHVPPAATARLKAAESRVRERAPR